MMSELPVSFFGSRILVSPYIPDYKSVRRTLKERFLSLPWRPWERLKSVYEPTVLQVGDTIYCSPQTYEKLMEQLGGGNR